MVVEPARERHSNDPAATLPAHLRESVVSLLMHYIRFLVRLGKLTKDLTSPLSQIIVW